LPAHSSANRRIFGATRCHPFSSEPPSIPWPTAEPIAARFQKGKSFQLSAILLHQRQASGSATPSAGKERHQAYPKAIPTRLSGRTKRNVGKSPLSVQTKMQQKLFIIKIAAAPVPVTCPQNQQQQSYITHILFKAKVGKSF